MTVRNPLIALALSLAGLPPSGQALAEQWHGPQNVYADVCRFCHDTGVGPALGRHDRQSTLDKDYIVSVTRHGKAGMPAFRQSEVSDAMLSALAEAIAQGTIPPHGGKP